MLHITPDDIIRLSAEERLNLIGQLWDSLDHADIPVTQAQQAELARRLAKLDQDRPHLVPWDALKAKLEQRCP